MFSQDTPRRFSCQPSGPFDLANQNRHFGGWPTLPGKAGAIVMAFPVEGSEHAAAAVIRQGADRAITGEVHGCPDELADAAGRQSLAAISLDVDGSGWPEVGSRDPVIGRLQASYGYLRPTLFHSPYEAACAFVIGHRISIRQTRALRARLAAELGTAVTIAGERFDAFPAPDQLLAADALPGINPTKTERLRAIARATQEGWLSREPLREMQPEAALAKIQTLPGIGPFFAQGILYRGAGTVDTLTCDPITSHAITHAYELKTAPDQQMLEHIAQAWRPYRMWTVVLLHVWARTELGLPPRRAARNTRVRQPGDRPPAR